VSYRNEVKCVLAKCAAFVHGLQVELRSCEKVVSKFQTLTNHKTECKAAASLSFFDEYDTSVKTVDMPSKKFKRATEGASRLLELPPELRNTIWTLACGDSKINPPRYGLILNDDPLSPEPASMINQPAITRTCRQIRAEALPIYYAITHFMVFPGPRHNLQALHDWLSIIGKDAHHIEQLALSTIVCHGWMTRTAHTYVDFQGVKVQITVQKGRLNFNVSHVCNGADSATIRKTVTTELESQLPKYMFNRSIRLRERSPGLASEEWVSVVKRVEACIDSLEEENLERRYQALTAEKENTGS